jgi:hypothetical protein
LRNTLQRGPENTDCWPPRKSNSAGKVRPKGRVLVEKTKRSGMKSRVSRFVWLSRP